MAMIDLGALGFDLLLKKDGWNKDFKEADNDVETHQSKWKTMAGNIGGGIKTAVVGGIAAIGAAVVGMGLAGAKSTDELNKALNGLQAETGTADEAMKGMKDSILNIYNGNYGESFEDIAKSMAEVGKATGLTGKELETATTNALTLRDTFGMEVTESMKSVNQLMDQFGLTSDQAFSMLVQGSQKGLDSTGELNDSIMEYSVQFAGLGLDASDMFNAFKNGADAGVYSVDKVGDAFKEFGIRAKDGSKTSMDAFSVLGLNADELTQKFNAGGTQAKEAFQQTAKALSEMTDPVAQNTAGVSLFGSMWEDVGVKGVLAMTNTKGEIDKTKDSLSKINEIKYDTFGEAVTGIKRNLETGILLPLGEKILPVLSQFSSWITAHMPEIKNEISFAMEIVGGVLGGFINIIEGLVSTFQNWGTENKNTIDGFTTIFSSFVEWAKGIFATFVEIIKVALEIIKTLWDKYGNDYLNIIKPIFEAIQTAISTAINVIKDIINIVLSAIKGDWSGVWEGVKQLFIDIWNGMANILPNLLEALVNIIKLQFTVFKDIGKGLFNGIWDGMKEIWEGISSWVSSKVSWLIDKLSFWRSGNEEMGGDSGADGSAFNGLDYVPFDGYRAILHEGERVLTKEENNSYNNNSGSGLSIIIEKFVNNRKEDSRALMEEMEFYRKQYQLANGGAY